MCQTCFEKRQRKQEGRQTLWDAIEDGTGAIFIAVFTVGLCIIASPIVILGSPVWLPLWIYRKFRRRR